MQDAAHTWPPAYTLASAPPVLASTGGGFPPSSWPTRDQLDYVKALITAVLLILALPWLAAKILTNPGYVLAGAGRRQLHTGAGA